MEITDKMLRLLVSNKFYSDTDINTAAYHGTTTEITYQKGFVLINILSFSLSSNGQEKQQLRLTEHAFKKWVEEQPEREHKKFARWVNNN